MKKEVFVLPGNTAVQQASLPSVPSNILASKQCYL